MLVCVVEYFFEGKKKPIRPDMTEIFLADRFLGRSETFFILLIVWFLGENFGGWGAKCCFKTCVPQVKMQF